MVVSKGGLSIKDYPFAFSLAALIFPSIIENNPAALTENAKLVGLLTIAFIGGMMGSILIITNPFGNILRYIYIWTSQNKILKDLRGNKFMDTVLKKNFDYAVRSPSISYESDKIIGMFYFVVLLSLALYRLYYDENFTSLLQLTSNEISLAGIFVIVGLIGVIISMVFNVIGIKSVSHLKRIETNCLLLSCSDFTNLSNEGLRVYSTKVSNNQQIVHTSCNTIASCDEKTKDIEEFKKQINGNELRLIFSQAGQHYDFNEFAPKLWELFKLFREIKEKYKIDFSDITIWFKDNRFFAYNEFDEPLTQLQSAIELRDWQNAILKCVRIQDRIKELFIKKQMYT